ncbi:anhydro-N-acetylmuramic acid kinase [Eleftheria terrae]|uniref:anhydro-N-acetylmuramic acid kinase n=1 Tax=Eleftheria terrae TaxID=1597781 RepID=UPI00263AB78A|nr:anhydro-N-acetylmuramic acid kinase [Eleftheria terrae]WKB54945.1 anhydro-N-acetylmuramic acid kinase [Eleftheria terrae]
MNDLYIGLMSGTSLDGVDGVLADFGPGAAPLRVLAHVAHPFEAGFRQQLLDLNTPGDNELHRAALAANQLARAYADVVQALLERAGLPPGAVQAIGAHGQTVRHRPGEFDASGYTIQLNNPALLAELSGVAVVSDFRSRDVAAGGQGAPLVPAFHRAVFGRPHATIAVLNLGGIANLTLLHADGRTLGFDCGPGNALMDLWCQRHLARPYDEHGAWAAQGRVQPALLSALLAEPWLQAPPPKSTGRDLFNTAWLERRLADHPASPVDIQATLCEFTAMASAHHLQEHAAQAEALLVCGGGAFNAELMRRLAALLPGVAVIDSGQRGLPPLQVEAAAFAWLARQRLHGAPGNLPAVTGAAGLRVLGGLHAP